MLKNESRASQGHFEKGHEPMIAGFPTKPLHGDRYVEFTHAVVIVAEKASELEHWVKRAKKRTYAVVMEGDDLLAVCYQKGGEIVWQHANLPLYDFLMWAWSKFDEYDPGRPPTEEETERANKFEAEHVWRPTMELLDVFPVF